MLINLLSNAVGYNRMAGRIDVCARSDAGANVIVDVRDTGVGMSAEQLDQLFQPFNRVGAEQTRVEGAGLGLVIARGLAEAMGGALDVSSTLGQGTCFSLRLHRAEGAPAHVVASQGPTTEAASPSSRDRPWQVLYVEDNTVNAPADGGRVGRHALHRAAQRHAGASRPPAAGHAIADTDGIGLLDRLRHEAGLQQVPAVAVSADAMPDAVDRALAQGFTAYWTKPLQLTSLPHRLEALLGGGAA